MNSSFSFSRLGVSSRLSTRPGASVVRRVHGDHVLVHRELAAVLRRSAALMSSPSGWNGSGGNGPPSATMFENVSGSL